MVVGFIGGIGPTELIVLLVIVMMLFGAGKLPHVMKQFGHSVRALRDAARYDED